MSANLLFSNDGLAWGILRHRLTLAHGHMSTVTKSTLILILLATTLALTACGGKDVLDKKPLANDEGIFRDAQRQLEIGSYERAINMMEQLTLFYPFSQYTRRARLDLIYAHYKVGNTEAAIDAADEFIRENPTHPNVDYAYYLRGLIYFDRDRNALEKVFRVDLTARPTADAERSLSYFAQLVRSYPDSEYAEDAKQRIVHLRERLAKFENHVARYYMSRRAWVAAVARARNVVEEYQDTGQVAESLHIMARAYRELGMEDLALDAERVLRENNYSVGNNKKKKRGLFRRNKQAEPTRPAS